MKEKPNKAMELQPTGEQGPSESPLKLFLWILVMPLGVIIAILTIQSLL